MKTTVLIHIIALVAITTIAYFNGLFGDFVLDDHLLISENPATKLDNPSSLLSRQFFSKEVWTNPGYYRPISSLSFWLDYRLWGSNPFCFHLTNLLMHIACVLLFYYLLVKYIPIGGRGVSWLAAALFALHPYHTESVTYISGRTDIIATIFILLTLIAYIEYRRHNKILPLFLGIITFILALLSKELALIVLPLLLLWEILLNRPFNILRVVLVLLPFVLVQIAYFPVRYALLGGSERALSVESLDNIGVRLFYSPYFLANYLVMLVAPVAFNAYRYTRFCRIEFGLREILTIIIVAGYLGLIVSLLRKQKRIIAFWLLFIAVSLLPVLNIVPIVGASIAERFLYLPSLGFSAVFAVGIVAIGSMFKRKPSEDSTVIASRRRSNLFALPRLLRPLCSLAMTQSLIVVIASIIVLSCYAGLIYTRNFDWRSDLTLFRSILRADAKSFVGHAGLADVFLDMGEYDSTIVHARAAIKGNPGIMPAWLNMAAAYTRIGRFASARAVLEQASRFFPDNAAVQNELGILASNRGKIEEARIYFESAIEADPEGASYLANLGKLELNCGNYPRAIELLERAYKINPDNPGVSKSLSEAYGAIGRSE